MAPGPAAALVTVALAGGCGRDAVPEGPPSSGGAGTYVAVSDSSRLSFVLPAAPEPLTGTFPVRGALTFEQDSRGFLTGSGAISVDLTRPALSDSAQALDLAELFFQVERSSEFREARLNVRQLTGQWLRAGVPAGAVRPVRAIGRLTVHGMALTRSFEGEMAPGPNGYRLTTTRPIVLSIAELKMEDELAAFAEAAALKPAGDAAIVAVDVWFSRREDAAATAERP